MRKRTKYKHKFDTVFFMNRWKRPLWDRSGSWVILGLAKDYFSPTEYEYRIAFFGFDIRIWMIREPVS